MNEKIRKLFISSMAILTGILLLFPVTIWGINADGESNSNEQNLTYIINNPFVNNWPYKYTTTANYTRVRFGINNTYSLVTDPQVYAFLYKRTQDSYWYMCCFTYGNTSLGSGNSANMVRYEYSTDGFTWNNVSSYVVSLTQTYTVNQEGAQSIVYGTSGQGWCDNPNDVPSNLPKIQLLQGQNETAVLGCFSTGNFEYLPWNFSTSSGGLHFSDGTDLDAVNTSKYSNIFLVMDVDHNNSVTEEEVNYYNYTYNTNYDYSAVNNNQNFDEMQFLLYIAQLIADGDENPGGGSGSGGGSGAISGGITIGDGSFTQSQTQTIEENAVNVTVNNNNELSQENMQYLNNVINNNLGTQGNAFGEAIDNINGFSSVARAFATLCGTVLGFMPAWVTTLLGLMFALLFVFVVFRLIHLFI